MKKILCLSLMCLFIFGCANKKVEDLKWSFQNSNTNEDILSISFADGKHGWACTAGGNLLATSDGGETWTANKVCDKKLTSVFAIDKKTIWTAGVDGALYSSMEGSSSMKEHILEKDVDFLDIVFWDDDNGLLVGNRLDRDSIVIGVVYHTTTGGAEWSEIYVDIDSITNVTTLGKELGWIATTGHIWTTSDHGANWDDNQLGDMITINAMYFDTYSSGFLVGDSGTYYTSSDFGWSWNKRGGEFPSNKLNDIIFFDRFGGFIVGEKGLIMITGDSGESWSFDDKLGSDLYDIAVEGKKLWICGANGKILQVH